MPLFSLITLCLEKTLKKASLTAKQDLSQLLQPPLVARKGNAL